MPCVFTRAGVILQHLMAQKLLTQDIQVLLHLSAVADVFPAAPFNGSNSTLFIPLHQPFQQVHLKVQGICTCTWHEAI